MNSNISKFKEFSRYMDVVYRDGDVYKVLVDNKDVHVVKLGTQECDYGV